jgi:hypothetical protein
MALTLLEERTQMEQGYDPYDSAGRKDIWRSKRKRA